MVSDGYNTRSLTKSLPSRCVKQRSRDRQICAQLFYDIWSILELNACTHCDMIPKKEWGQILEFEFLKEIMDLPGIPGGWNHEHYWALLKGLEHYPLSDGEALMVFKRGSDMIRFVFQIDGSGSRVRWMGWGEGNTAATAVWRWLQLSRLPINVCCSKDKYHKSPLCVETPEGGSPRVGVPCTRQKGDIFALPAPLCLVSHRASPWQLASFVPRGMLLVSLSKDKMYSSIPGWLDTFVNIIQTCFSVVSRINSEK